LFSELLTYRFDRQQTREFRRFLVTALFFLRRSSRLNGKGIWVVSSDCQSIYGVKDATLPHPSGTATPLDDLGTTTTFERRGEL
jgi:hypothetical protein